LATDAGVSVLGNDFEPLPTGDDLRKHWLKELPEGERKILAILIEKYPDEVDRRTLSEATGYAQSSRNTYLQRLGARELISTSGGPVKASDTLFS
jgi:DNA-binding MarR family transcriptional regulator